MRARAWWSARRRPLGPKGHEAATRVLRGLDQGLFDYTRFDLPQSGEVYLLVTSESQEVKDRSGPALDLVRRSMAEVETFAGRYRSKYLVVSVFGDLGRNCGIAQLIDDAPGIVSLNLPCLQEPTVMHEVAHVFIGGGPTWFAEGVADLVYFRFRGRSGAYLARAQAGQATGQIQLNGHLTLGSEAYLNQSALGAAFLVEVYRLIGPGPMAAAVQEISAMGPRRVGRVILSTLLTHTPAEQRPQLIELVRSWIRGAG